MKRIFIILTLLLCCSLIVPNASAEAAPAQRMDFPAFSFTASEGSLFMRGDSGSGTLFVYYPDYARGDTGSTIIASQDTLVQYNPLTMSDQERDAFGRELLAAAVSSVRVYGYTASDGTWTWGNQIQASGQTGIMMSYHYVIDAGGTSYDAWGISCFFCVGPYRYNFTAGSDSEQHCRALLESFFQTFSWK